MYIGVIIFAAEHFLQMHFHCAGVSIYWFYLTFLPLL